MVPFMQIVVLPLAFFVEIPYNIVYKCICEVVSSASHIHQFEQEEDP